MFEIFSEFKIMRYIQDDICWIMEINLAQKYYTKIQKIQKYKEFNHTP